MIKSYKLSLIQLHLITSFLWNYLINIAEQIKYILFSSFICFFIIYFDKWPDQIYLKNFYLFLFIFINSFFYIKFHRKTKTKVTFFKIKERLQTLLNLKNSELSTIIDEPVSQTSQDEERIFIWNNFKSTALKQIETNYNFRFKYFFISLNKLSKLTKIIIPVWVIILVFFINTSFLNNFYNSLNYQTDNIFDLKFSTNIWIYPSDKKKKVIFIEKKSDDKTIDMNNILINPKSKILINVYDVPRKYLDIKVSKNGINKILKKGKTLKKTITYEDLVDEGEYQILIKNKIFQRINILFDRRPQIKFTDIPTTDKNNSVKFNYSLIDENNAMTWLEIFSLNSKISNQKNIDFKTINKLGVTPANLVLVDRVNSDDQFGKKKKVVTFTRNMLNQPLAGSKVKIRLTSIDKANQLGRSKVYDYNLPSKIFRNVFAKKIIQLRKELYIKQDLKKFRKNLKKIVKSLKKQNSFTKKKLKELIEFTANTKLDKNIIVEKILIVSWEAAIFLEQNDYESLIDQIKKLKKKLEMLISNNAKENEIRKVMDKLESLLERYLEKETKEKSENNDIKENKKEEKKEPNFYKDKAKELLKKLDDILEEKEFLDIDIKKLIDELQNIYKKQTLLIEKTFLIQKEKSSPNSLLVFQQNIFSKYSKIKDDLIKALSSEGKLLLFLEEGFSSSENRLEKNELSMALENQKGILLNLEKIIKVLKSKAKSSQKNDSEEQSGVNKGRNQEQENFDVPIIFEKNLFDKIIEKIRKMTNQKDRENREREYLKNLLPKF